MTEAVIAAACRHWGLGNAPVTLVGMRENLVYRIETESGPVALRLHRSGYRTIEEIRSELQWMGMLSDQRLAVPTPIYAPDGNSVMSFEGVIVDLLSWLDGTPLSQTESESNTAIYHELGHVLALMHNYADVWELPPGFHRPTWDVLGNEPTWGRYWENPMLTSRQVSDLTDFHHYAKASVDALTVKDVGLIHADLVPDNILVVDRAQTEMPKLSVIDFDDGGFGYRLFDLATITYRSRRIDKTGSLAKAAVNGYRAGRCNGSSGSHNGGDQEEGFLPETLALFEAIRACSYIGWNIARMEEPGAMARNERFISGAENAINSWLTANAG